MDRVSQITETSVELTASFLRSLRAENKPARTVESYGDACCAFDRFLADRGMPRGMEAVAREHLEALIQELGDGDLRGQSRVVVGDAPRRHGVRASAVRGFTKCGAW